MNKLQRLSRKLDTKSKILDLAIRLAKSSRGTLDEYRKGLGEFVVELEKILKIK